MTDDTVVALRQPGEFEDLLTDVLRQGARKLLAQAVEAEVADFLSAHADLTTEDGRQRLVRHGHLPERTVQTGIGPVDVQQPRVRDRGGDDERDPLFAGDPAALCPPLEEPGCLDPDPLSARDLERRLSRSAFRPARQGCAQSIARRAWSAQGVVEGGIRALATA